MTKETDRRTAGQQIKLFLDQIQSGFLQIRALHRVEGDENKMRGNYWLPANSDAKKVGLALDWCEQHAKAGDELYLGANAREREEDTQAAVVYLTACVLDLDVIKHGAKIRDALHALETAPVVPHVVIHSGRGLHVVWFIRATTNREAWRLVMRALCYYFRDYGADTQAAPQEQFMPRLVPYPNLKDGQRRATKLQEMSKSHGDLTLEILGENYQAKQVQERERAAAVTSPLEGDEHGRIPDGQRNVTLTSLAGSMRRKALLDEEAIVAALLQVNRTRCVPPLPDDTVRRIVRSVMRYQPAELTAFERGNEPEEENLTDSGSLVRPLGAFLTETFDDTEPLIYGLHRRELGMLNSYPNVGKTTLCLNMAMSAAAGLMFPPFTVNQRPLKIMYLDFENRSVRLQRDVATMVEYFGGDYRTAVEKNLLITVDARFSNVPLSLTDPVHLHRIARLAQTERVDLIIVDTLSAAVSLVNENDNAEVKRKVIEPFQALANYANAAILFVHHIGKGNESDNTGVYQYRGASVLGAYCRLVLKLSPDQGHEDSVVLRCAKVKGMPFSDTIFELDRNSRWFKHTDLVVPTETSAYQRVVEAVNILYAEDVNTEGKKPALKRARIMAKLGEMNVHLSEETVKRRLKEAVTRGDLDQIATGVYAPMTIQPQPAKAAGQPALEPALPIEEGLAEMPDAGALPLKAHAASANGSNGNGHKAEEGGATDDDRSTDADESTEGAAEFEEI